MNHDVLMVLRFVIALAATSPIAALTTSLTNGDLELPVLADVAGEGKPPTGWHYGWDVMSRYPRALHWHGGGRPSVIPSSGDQKVSFAFPSGAAQNNHECIGKSIWAYQSIGTVTARDVGSVLVFTANGGPRPSPPVVADCTLFGEVSLRIGVTSASMGTLKGTAASITARTIDTSNPMVLSSRSMGEATYSVQAGDIGQELFVVVGAKVLAFANQGNKDNQGPPFMWDSAVLNPGSATANDSHLDANTFRDTTIKVEKEVDILPPGPPLGMMKMVQAPDGAIYLNTQSFDSTRALLKSADRGQTWTVVPVKFTHPRVWPSQTIWGFTVTRDGRLWAVHQATGHVTHGGFKPTGVKPWPEDKVKPMWVSRSSDGGRTWKSTMIDFAGMIPPGGSKNPPYMRASTSYSCLIERPDCTVMFAFNALYQRDRIGFNEYFSNPDASRRGIPYVMIRTKDGGMTWEDPTFVRRWGATETDFAVDPKNPDHILAMSRKQRGLVPGEDKETVYRQARAPLNFGYPFKGGQLLESTDGGRTFHEVANAYTGLYGHRGTICWTDRDVVIVSYMFNPNLPQGARASGPPKVLLTAAGISLDGGKTWLDDTVQGTTDLDKAKRFVLNPKAGGTAPTIEVSPNRYLTVHGSDRPGSLEGFYWYLADTTILRLPSVKSGVMAPATSVLCRSPRSIERTPF